MKNFKLLLTLLFFVGFSSLSFAQKTDWKEQKDFHQVMSTTFHPAEEGNFAPIKSKSAELLEKAVAWQKSPIPATVHDQAKVKKTLKNLVKGAKNVNNAVKKGASNDELISKLTSLHDVFHTIVGLCRDEDDHKH